MMAAEGIKKLYYSIGEIGAMMGLEAHVLRYWETEFDELKPRKNRAGRRIYTAEDIAVVERILFLLRTDKYTIEGAKQVLHRETAPQVGETDAKRELRRLRSFLENLKGQIE